MKKRDYHNIDPLIEPLVKTFNQCGFTTFASCQGHRWPVDHTEPYIAFKAEPNKAARLERRLREEMISINSSLRWAWKIDGWFNRQYELCFALRAYEVKWWYYRYWRPSINHDFAVIEKILITEFGFISPIQ